MSATPPGDGPGEPGPADAEAAGSAAPAPESDDGPAGWELPGDSDPEWDQSPGSAPTTELPAVSWSEPGWSEPGWSDSAWAEPGWPGSWAENAAEERGGVLLAADGARPGADAVPGAGDPVTAGGPGRPVRFPASRAPRWTPRRGRPPRGRTRWRAAFYLLAVAAVVAGVSWALLGDRLLVVRSVGVSGTHLVAPQQVLAAAAVPVGAPLATVDSAAVIRRVEAIRQVASARVSKDWPDRLQITVTERVPVMGVKMAGGGYDLVDQDGVIVRWSKSKPAGLPQLSTALAGGALAGDPGVTTAAGVLAELQPALAKQVKQVRPQTLASGAEQVTLNLRGGQTVEWGGTDNAAHKNRELTVLLPGGARDIDVSAPGTVVTR